MIAAGTWLLLAGLAVSPPRPHPELGPGEVIRTVAEALQNINSPLPNAGIFTAYQFASPGNRAATGPYGRFLRIVKGPESRPLLGKHAHEFGELVIRGDEAEQEVRLGQDDGTTITYRFILSRQTSPTCSRCWLVDGVLRLP
jgi:hypothetical protein